MAANSDSAQMTDRQRVAYKDAVAELDGLIDKDLTDHLVRRAMKFQGNFDVLESALGALIVGRLVGWRVLTLIHSSRTINKYQDVLGLDFKGQFPWSGEDVMPEKGPFAQKSLALRVAERVGDFWRVVRGQTDEISSSTERKSSLPLPD